MCSETWASLGGSNGKESYLQSRSRFNHLAGRPLEKKMAIHSCILEAGNSLDRGTYKPFSLMSISSLDFLADTVATLKLIFCMQSV